MAGKSLELKVKEMIYLGPRGIVIQLTSFH
jgi:hypothetical protein